MKKPIHPCPKECPKRKVGCRTECEEWQKYEKAHSQYMKEKEEKRESEGQYAMFQKERKLKSAKKRRKE